MKKTNSFCFDGRQNLQLYLLKAMQFNQNETSFIANMFDVVGKNYWLLVLIQFKVNGGENSEKIYC